MTMAATYPPVLTPPLLLASDGSPAAQQAQAWVCGLVQTLGLAPATAASPPVQVVTVQPQRSRRSPHLMRLRRAADTASTDPAAVPTPPAELEATTLRQTLQQTWPASCPAAFEVRQGRPAAEILAQAQAVQARLIAVGQRGHSGVRELLLGSVSTVIARYAPCSVLIARGDRPLPDPFAVRHILLLVDGSAASRQAIALIQQLRPAGAVQVTLFCVQAPINANYLFGPFVSPTPSWQLNQSLQAAQKQRNAHILQQAQALLEEIGVQVEVRSPTGETGPLVCQAASERPIDLILLGNDARRRSINLPLQRLKPGKRHAADNPPTGLLRNTRLTPADDYIIHHAPCPVLIYRPRDRGPST